MSLSNVLQSESALTVLGAVLGGAWTFFKSTELYSRIRRQKAVGAIEALEAGVELTYRTYVEAIKEARADGRLTEDEKRQARQLAREAAIEFGRGRGVDVLNEVGEDYVDLWIAKLVKKLKTK